MVIETITVEFTNFNLTDYSEQVRRGLLTEGEFIANGFREEKYIGYREEDRRNLLKIVWGYILQKV